MKIKVVSQIKWEMYRDMRSWRGILKLLEVRMTNLYHRRLYFF